MAVDWSIFGIDLLTAIISSLFTLLIGWLIAWVLIHKYQKRNMLIQGRDKIIEEITSFKIALHETTSIWVQYEYNKKDINLWILARKNIFIIQTKQENLFAKILNRYPDYFMETFSFQSEIKEIQPFKMKDIAATFKAYHTKILSNFNDRKYVLDKDDPLLEIEREVVLYLAIVVNDIIKKSSYEFLKKNRSFRKKILKAAENI